MVYEIVFKKRFRNKLEKLLIYIETKFGFLIAEKFAQQFGKKFKTLQQQPFIGIPSIFVIGVRSISAGKQKQDLLPDRQP